MVMGQRALVGVGLGLLSLLCSLSAAAAWQPRAVRAHALARGWHHRETPRTVAAAMKDGAPQLLESGKTVAAAGEKLIEADEGVTPPTARANAGARIRNAGDNIADAGAKARFKSGAEGVSWALRTAAEELDAAAKMLSGDEDAAMGSALAKAAEALEKGGFAAAVGEGPKAIGAELSQAGAALAELEGLFGDGAALLQKAGEAM